MLSTTADFVTQDKNNGSKIEVQKEWMASDLSFFDIF